MGERVRSTPGLSDEDLDWIEEQLENWIEDHSNGATVLVNVKYKPGRKTKKSKSVDSTRLYKYCGARAKSGSSTPCRA